MNLPAGSKGSVRELEVGTYKDLKSREVVDDALEHDHIPSFAALKAAKEQKLGRPLTSLEEKMLYNNATAIEVPKEIHQAGRTYGGKNTLEQITRDAQDLCNAINCDTVVLRQNLLNRGYVQKDIDAAIDQIIKTNKDAGVIK